MSRSIPTLEEVMSWPATVDVTTAAQPYGMSRAHAYELCRLGKFPARVIVTGAGRYRVVTASIIRTLRADVPA